MQNDCAHLKALYHHFPESLLLNYWLPPVVALKMSLLCPPHFILPPPPRRTLFTSSLPPTQSGKI